MNREASLNWFYLKPSFFNFRHIRFTDNEVISGRHLDEMASDFALIALYS